MSEEYHELENVRDLADEAELEIPRARALLSAIRGQRDYKVVKLLQYAGENNSRIEYIVVDVETDGVPPKNPVGIDYLERLALCIPSDAKSLVNVLALRKAFPVMIHQNQSVVGEPASLCLYFEPVSGVLRTWTPQNFLRRIQWWLEKSARGELHPADQPVENLFFSTRYELVLPWNFEQLRQIAGQRFVILRGPERPDQGLTLFVEATSLGAQVKDSTVAYVELALPAIVHGFVERDPPTLGALADILLGRGIDLFPPLQAVLQQRVGQDGAQAKTDDTCTVILLHIPVCRGEGESPDRTYHRAFFIPSGAMKLGVATGALFEHNKNYYSAVGLLNQEEPTGWRTERVFPMEVLHQNSTSIARSQSGITDEGPSGVLIGAGSLGSEMLNLWGRSGWGRWTVIDKDHIKPHNLARHVAFFHHVGELKVNVAAELHRAVMHGASELKVVHGDACDFSLVAVTEALGGAQLVVDASTTLEYPRMASTSNEVGRHISVFLTPNGHASVLLAEDERRKNRLRTLEAQYYRALIAEEWGRTHLDGNLSSFWSGASCRDISIVMPYSRITSHASTLAEQVQLVSRQPLAKIRVWQRDAETGAVAVHDVAVQPEQCHTFDELSLYIDDGVETCLRTLRTASLPNETGGVLLGYYDFNIKAVLVVDAMSAPPDSKASPQAFERGIAGLAETVAEASRRTAGIVGYIGEWHSHPRGHSASPSRDDFIQLVHLALGMSADGLPAVQLIVGENDIQVFQGTVHA